MERNNFVGEFTSVKSKLMGIDDSIIDTNLYKIGPIKVNPKTATDVVLTFHEDDESKLLARLVSLSDELASGGAVQFKMSATTNYGEDIVRNIILPVDDMEISLTDLDYNCGDQYISKIFVKLTYSSTRVEVFEVSSDDEADEDESW